jgi:hypothetical protein
MKYGLCIGINYCGTTSALKGCCNDALQMKAHLDKHDFQVTMLCDDAPEVSSGIPTKQNILNSLSELVNKSNSSPNSQIVLHYSGHGSSTTDRNGDELDNRDELIVTADMKGITDDELMDCFISKLNPDVMCFCLFDSCHSGSILDLEYRLEPDNSFVIENERKIQSKVMCVSGCRDSGTSADAFIKTNTGSSFAGAMTYTFFDVYNNDKSLHQIVDDMRIRLKNSGHAQIPQITMTDTSLPDKKITGFFE